MKNFTKISSLALILVLVTSFGAAQQTFSWDDDDVQDGTGDYGTAGVRINPQVDIILNFVDAYNHLEGQSCTIQIHQRNSASGDFSSNLVAESSIGSDGGSFSYEMSSSQVYDIVDNGCSDIYKAISSDFPQSNSDVTVEGAISSGSLIQVNNNRNFWNIEYQLNPNTAPQINSVNTVPVTPTFQESISYESNVTDDGNVSSVNADVWKNGVKVSSNVALSDSNNDDVWNVTDLFSTDTYGEYVVGLNATDNEGAWTYRNDTYQFNDKMQTVNTSTNVQNGTENNISYDFSQYLNSDQEKIAFKWNVRLNDSNGKSAVAPSNGSFTLRIFDSYRENISEDVGVSDSADSQIFVFREEVIDLNLQDSLFTNISLSRSVSENLVLDSQVSDSVNPFIGVVQDIGVDTTVADTLIRVQNVVQDIGVDTGQSENYSLTRNIIENNALYQSVDGTVELFREEQEAPVLATKVSDSWNPFIDAQVNSIVSTNFNTDLGIIEGIVQQITVDEKQLETTGPREENTTIYGESLGAANYSTTVEVTVDDPEGDNIDTISIGDVTVDFPDNRSTRTANITLGDVKEFNGSIRATDVTGTTRDIPLSFDITDNPYVQTTSGVNLTAQDVNKTDSIINLGTGKDFYFVITHSALGQTATSNATHRGRVFPGNTSDDFTTDFYGDFLLEDTNQWVQNDDKTSTDEEQFIRRGLNIESLTGDTWESVSTPTVQPQTGFSPCEICSRNPVTFSGDFENTHFYTDSGDIIETELTGTVGDFVIGERDTYFEQYRYTQQEDGLTLSNIHVTETINDSEIGYGSFLNVEVDNSYGNNLLEVKPTITCTTSMPSFSTGTFDNQEWKACSQDLNGNTVPETFKVVIPAISTDNYNEEIRIGGFTGEPPEDDIDPFPGLQTDCRNGERDNDLICVRDQWRTEAQATRQLSIANAEAGQVGESVGIVSGLLILLFAVALWRRDEDENNR